jgi:hypothetical protein
VLASVGVATPAPPARADQAAARAPAEAASAAKVAEWLDTQIGEGRDMPLDDMRDVAFSFAYELYTLRPPEEIERLRKEIEGKPDHPMRRVVEGYDRMLEDGPSVFEYAARVRGWDRWRLNQDRPPGDPTAWNDTVVTPTHAFQLNPDQIALIDPRVGYPEGRQLNSMSNEIWNAINALVYADLGTRRQRITRDDVRVDGALWSCQIRKLGQTIRCEGRWIPEWERGVVDRATVIENPDAPAYVGWYKTFGGWRMEPAIGRPVAVRAEQRFPDGSIAYAYVFRGAEREDAGVFERVTAVPDIAGADPLRGAISATSMWDFREGEQRYVSDDGGARSVINQGPFPGARRKQGRLALRRVGWTLLGALVLGLVALRLWRVSRQ